MWPGGEREWRVDTGAQDASEEEIAHDGLEEETAQDASEEETAQDASEEETAQDASEEETSQDAPEEETAQDASEEEAAQDASEEEFAQDASEKDIAQDGSEEEIAMKGPEELHNNEKDDTSRESFMEEEDIEESVKGLMPSEISDDLVKQARGGGSRNVSLVDEEYLKDVLHTGETKKLPVKPLASLWQDSSLYTPQLGTAPPASPLHSSFRSEDDEEHSQELDKALGIAACITPLKPGLQKLPRTPQTSMLPNAASTPDLTKRVPCSPRLSIKSPRVLGPRPLSYSPRMPYSPRLAPASPLITKSPLAVINRLLPHSPSLQARLIPSTPDRRKIQDTRSPRLPPRSPFLPSAGSSKVVASPRPRSRNVSLVDEDYLKDALDTSAGSSKVRNISLVDEDYLREALDTTTGSNKFSADGSFLDV